MSCAGVRTSARLTLPTPFELSTAPGQESILVVEESATPVIQSLDSQIRHHPYPLQRGRLPHSPSSQISLVSVAAAAPAWTSGLLSYLDPLIYRLDHRSFDHVWKQLIVDLC